ncbi:unnamed protein product, partial [marine sediment metagenome]
YSYLNFINIIFPIRKNSRIKNIVTPKLISVMLLVSACGALAPMVNIFTGISSVPGGYIMMVVPNSPRHKTNESTKAVNIEGRSKGMLILKNLFIGDMPMILATSSSETGTCFMPLPIILAAINPNLPT